VCFNRLVHASLGYSHSVDVSIIGRVLGVLGSLLLALLARRVHFVFL